MPDRAPDGWRNLTAREADAQFAAALIRIGERLAKDASIIGAMQSLLDELRRRRALQRNGG